MPVHNAEEFLKNSVDSILNQSLSDFELIVWDDASTDNSLKILKSFDEPRIKVYNNHAQLGLPATLNKALEVSTGKYIARMDADDIASPDRLEKQVNFLRKHPEISITGSFIQTFGESNEIWKYPTDPSYLKAYLLFDCGIAHPSIMMRKDHMITYNLTYNETFTYSQDYELWERASQNVAITNIPAVLLKYRITNSCNDKSNYLRTIRSRALNRLGIEASKEDLDYHGRLNTWNHPVDLQNLIKLTIWVNRLEDANTAKKVYDTKVFEKVLFDCCWMPHFRNIKQFNFKLYSFVKRTRFYRMMNLSTSEKFKFFIKCLIRYKA